MCVDTGLLCTGADVMAVPQDRSQVRTCAGECLAYLAAQYCPDLSGSQHAKKQILEVYRPLLIIGEEYSYMLYDYRIRGLRIWTLTPIGRG